MSRQSPVVGHASLVVGPWSLVVGLGRWVLNGGNLPSRFRRCITLASCKCSLWLKPTTNDQGPTTINSQGQAIPTPSRRSERGYILLMLMLFVTLLAIAAGASLPALPSG